MNVILSLTAGLGNVFKNKMYWHGQALTFWLFWIKMQNMHGWLDGRPHLGEGGRSEHPLAAMSRKWTVANGDRE
jgi:hypothetical protein